MQGTAYGAYKLSPKPTSAEIETAKGFLLEGIFEPPVGSTYGNGTPRLSGVPTMGEIHEMMYLDSLKINQENERLIENQRDLEVPLMHEDASGQWRMRRYPANPYTAVPRITHPVHMPNGRIKNWTLAELEKHGGIPWDVRFGAEMHFDPRTKTIFSVQRANFNAQNALDRSCED